MGIAPFICSASKIEIPFNTKFKLIVLTGIKTQFLHSASRFPGGLFDAHTTPLDVSYNEETGLRCDKTPMYEWLLESVKKDGIIGKDNERKRLEDLEIPITLNYILEERTLKIKHFSFSNKEDPLYFYAIHNDIFDLMMATFEDSETPRNQTFDKVFDGYLEIYKEQGSISDEVALELTNASLFEATDVYGMGILLPGANRYHYVREHFDFFRTELEKLDKVLMYLNYAGFDLVPVTQSSFKQFILRLFHSECTKILAKQIQAEQENEDY